MPPPCLCRKRCAEAVNLDAKEKVLSSMMTWCILF